MTLSSLYFFISYGAVSFLIPYMALFYQGQGMSGGQIGLLTAIPPIISFFAAPLWTGAADATRRHKLVTVIATVAVVIVAFIFPGMASFGGLLLMVSLFAFTNSPISSLVNSAVLVQMGDRKHQYGRVRLWGTIGYGILAPFGGTLIGRLGLQWSFWGFAILMLVSLLVVFLIPFQQSHVRSMNFFGQGVRVLLRNKAWVLFLVMVLIAGVGMATVNNYLFVFMNYLGASKSLMGIALTVSTISEIPAMFFSDRLIRRYGARGMLVIALTVIGLRLIFYSLTAQPWVILLIQLMHGLTYAVIYTAGVYYADQIAPPGLNAVTQGMFAGTFMGFGSAAGGLLGGLLLDRFSPEGMYAIVGTVVLLGMIIFLIVERRFYPPKRAEHETV
jgi:PPP family 3-phenylpropionic acid transporter